MSEDADFVIPWDESRTHRGTNAHHIDKVRDTLRNLAPQLGMRFERPDGEEFERRSHVIWEVDYGGRYPPTSITVEAAMRPVLRPARRAPMLTMLRRRLVEPYRDARCWALDADEVSAEKVRAAFTHQSPEIRDFYDLQLLRDSGADFASAEFVALVDKKLAEVGHVSLADAQPSFGLTAAQQRHLMGPGFKRLESVTRLDAPRFDLNALLVWFDELWGKAMR